MPDTVNTSKNKKLSVKKGVSASEQRAAQSGKPGKTVESILGENGIVAQGLGRYEFRPQQIDMANAVLDSLCNKEILIVEAATGTGKTLAYLVPALLSGRRVVVSTGTKALQEQLFQKDIPFLAKHWHREVKAVLLKGRRNYLCKVRFDEMMLSPKFRAASDVQHWATIKKWAKTTETGDRADVEGLPDDFPTWQDLSVGSEACKGSKCPHYDSCYVTKARKEANEAELIVVNHHLFFADLALKQGGFGEVIPEHDAIIFDEAHHLENVASSYFGMECSNWRVNELILDLKRAMESEGTSDDDLEKSMKSVTQKATSFFSMLAFGHYEGRYPLSMILEGSQKERIQESYRLFGVALTELERELKRFSGASELSERLAERAADLKFETDELMKCDDEKYTYFMEIRDRGVFLNAAPIDLAELFQQKLLRNHDTIVFTSATLSTNDNFTFFKQRMGLKALPPLIDKDAEEKKKEVASSGSGKGSAKTTISVKVEESKSEEKPEKKKSKKKKREVKELMLPPVFHYKDQCLVYVPKRLPPPNSPKFIEGVVQIVEYLVNISQGRAFVLFTSWSNMNAAYEELEDKLPFKVLKQGTKPKSELIREFKDDEHSVLFATSSFWEGVDVEGDALRLVIIDKLPFASPADPLNKARMDLLEARGKSSFHDFSVPGAALMLKQGFGRLIRSRSDMGVVAILDSRIATKRYGSHFIKSLPPAPVVWNAVEVKNWWHEKFGEPED